MTSTADAGDARSIADARRARWLSLVGSWIIRLLGVTWRVRMLDAGPVDRLRHDGQPVALLLWHGQLLPLLYIMRFQSIATLISTHRDGELIAQTATEILLFSQQQIPKFAKSLIRTQ